MNFTDIDQLLTVKFAGVIDNDKLLVTPKTIDQLSPAQRKWNPDVTYRHKILLGSLVVGYKFVELKELEPEATLNVTMTNLSPRYNLVEHLTSKLLTVVPFESVVQPHVPSNSSLMPRWKPTIGRAAGSSVEAPKQYWF